MRMMSLSLSKTISSAIKASVRMLWTCVYAAPIQHLDGCCMCTDMESLRCDVQEIIF